MSNIIPLDIPTKGDIPVGQILEGASGANLQEVVVVGWIDGEGHYLATSSGDAAAILLLLELAKKRVLEECTSGE